MIQAMDFRVLLVTLHKPFQCSSCDISWNPVHSVLVPATIKLGLTTVEAKVVIPSDVQALCRPFYGGEPFIDKYCRVQGITFRRPALAMGALFTVPLANQISTSCVITIITPVFDSCNEKDQACEAGC